MEKVYMIRQLNSTMLNDYVLEDESGFYMYYASTDLSDIEDKIKNNWTDLWETVYPYVALVTVNLNSVGAVHDPIRIFEYQENDTYKEVAYFNMLFSSDNDDGIKYLEDYDHYDCNNELIELGDKVRTTGKYLWGEAARVTRQFVGEVIMGSNNRMIIATIHEGEYLAIKNVAGTKPGEVGTFAVPWRFDDSWSDVEIMKTSSGKVRTDNKGKRNK